MNDTLAEAARGAVLAMALWGLDWMPEYAALLAALLAALNAHDERVIGEAVAMVRTGEAA